MLYGEVITESGRGLRFRVAGGLGDAFDFGISGDVWFEAGDYELVGSPFDGLRGLRVSRATLLKAGRQAA